MRVGRMVASAGGIALAGAAARQHQHDLERRRTRAQDRQALWYDHEAFHVITFLRCDRKADTVAAVRSLYRATRHYRDVQWIYAGKAVLTGAVSTQIGPVDWDAVVVQQYASAKDHQMVSRSLVYQQALEPFAATYSCGFRRSRTTNAIVPQVLGLGRAVRRLRSEETVIPFPPRHDPDAPADLGRSGSLDDLLAERDLGTEGAVVFSLIKRRGPEHRDADRRFRRQMLALMAEGQVGPMHLGRAVALEGEHDFDTVAAVFYPNLQFLADLAGSELSRHLSAHEAAEDLHTVVTAPILYRL